jgi:SPP1 gp7 family putative phage head morphogenesis protein
MADIVERKGNLVGFLDAKFQLTDEKNARWAKVVKPDGGRVFVAVNLEEAKKMAVGYRKKEVDPSSEDFQRKAASGYVEVPGGPVCGNCEYLQGNKCIHPDTDKTPDGRQLDQVVKFQFDVDIDHGCCSYWEADDDAEPDTSDWARTLRHMETEKRVSAATRESLFGVKVEDSSRGWVMRLRDLFFPRKQLSQDDIDELLKGLKDKSAQEQVERIVEAYQDAIGSGIDDAEEELGVDVSFGLTSEEAVQYAEEQSSKLVGGKGIVYGTIDETTRDAIRGAVSEGIRTGREIPEIAQLIKDVFDDAKDRRAMLIARTETLRSNNWAALQAYKEAGVEKQEWLVAPDYDPTDDDGECDEYDGEIVGVDEDFHDGEFGPPLHPGCRCIVVPVTKEEEEEAAAEEGGDEEEGKGVLHSVVFKYKTKYGTPEARKAKLAAVDKKHAPVIRNFENRMKRYFQVQQDAVLKRLRRHR